MPRQESANTAHIHLELCLCRSRDLWVLWHRYHQTEPMIRFQLMLNEKYNMARGSRDWKHHINYPFDTWAFCWLYCNWCCMVPHEPTCHMQCSLRSHYMTSGWLIFTMTEVSRGKMWNFWFLCQSWDTKQGCFPLLWLKKQPKCIMGCQTDHSLEDSERREENNNTAKPIGESGKHDWT